MTPLRKNRDFILLQTGQTLSTIGSESTAIAYPLLVLAVTHSPAKAGVVGFARVVPWALFGVFAGVATDRFPRKPIMMTADVVRAVMLGTIAFAIAIGHLTFVQIAIVAFVEGSMYVFFNIAEVGALRSVVSKEQLPVAAAAEQARFSTVTIVAPPLGGALFGIGRAFPFVLGALSPAFSLGTLLAIRTPFQGERVRDDASIRDQLAEGFRWLWKRPFLRTCALIFAVQNMLFEGMFLIFVVAARRQGLSGGQIGLLIAIVGALALGGSITSPYLQKAFSVRALLIGFFWVQLAIAAFVIHPSVYVLLAGYAPGAFFGPSVAAVVIGYRVAVTPDHLVGRVNSVARSIALCMMPLGPLIAGILLGALSARETVAIFAVLLGCLTLAGTLAPSIRNAPSLDELKEPDEPLTPPELPELAQPFA